MNYSDLNQTEKTEKSLWFDNGLGFLSHFPPNKSPDTMLNWNTFLWSPNYFISSKLWVTWAVPPPTIWCGIGLERSRCSSGLGNLVTLLHWCRHLRLLVWISALTSAEMCESGQQPRCCPCLTVTLKRRRDVSGSALTCERTRLPISPPASAHSEMFSLLE